MIPADPYHPGLRQMVTTIPSISLGPLVSYVLLAGVFHFLGLIFYRLYLSPLRHFSGPRLAAATQWYETYYELFHQGGGSFTKEIKKLHAQYGPIVRINPWELHTDDPEYYETIYASSAPFDKLPVLENRFGVPSAAFSTSAHTVCTSQAQGGTQSVLRQESDSDVNRKLHDEFHTAIPDPAKIPSWAQLQKLPYLTACTEEGLRLGFGVVQRSPRIAPTALTYSKYVIPPGTPVSQDTYHMHTNEKVFPI